MGNRNEGGLENDGERQSGGGEVLWGGEAPNCYLRYLGESSG